LKPKNKPRVCYLDGDGILFKSASSGEIVWRVAKDKDGNEIARFDSVSAYNNWIFEIETFETDIHYGYKGDVADITRETEYELKDPKECEKVFKREVKKVLKATGCDEIRVYISKKAGTKVFRHKLATLHEYKKGRSNQRKPYYLEYVRKFARGLNGVVVVRGDIEVDDRVVELAEKGGRNACLAAEDKDSLQAKGCWVYHIGKHEKPVWSNPKIVGRIGKRDNGSTKMLGWLSLMYQMMKGDKQVDGIVGLPKYGDKKAYELLKEFDNKPINVLPEVVRTVLREYYRVYGESHEYEHWDGSVVVSGSYKSIFEENLLLLYMRRFKDDNCRVIMNIVDNITIEELEKEAQDL